MPLRSLKSKDSFFSFSFQLSNEVLYELLSQLAWKLGRVKAKSYKFTSDESELSSAQIQLKLARLVGFSARLCSWDFRVSSCHKNWPKRAESGAWAKKGQCYNHNYLKC